jgi:hypothetical protein
MRRVALLLAALALAQDDHDVQAVRTLLPRARGIERAEVELTAEQVSRIEKALGARPPRRVVFHRAGSELMWHKPGEHSLRVTAFSCEVGGRAVRFALAILPEERMVAGVAPLEDREDLDEFLAQFTGMPYSEASLFNSLDRMREIRAKGKEPSEEGRQIRTLIEVQEAMRRIQSGVEALGRKLRDADKRAAEDARALAESLETVRGSAAGALFLQERHRTTFESIAARSRGTAEEIARLAGEGGFGEASRRLQQMATASCGGCHGSFQRRFVEARGAVGLGAGYFVPRVDLTESAGPDAETQHRLGRAVRQAVQALHLVR